ncbi:MAG: hypothetical protein J7507_06005 [Pseudoxanthomonas sp.]|nr:hypothetical protein [Pseudoxanthomonas sp.]
MKKRLLTSLACALALGGCASYGYVDDGGGYYTGGASTEYVYPPYAYGVYGYGTPYYRYNPGWSFGLGYGYGGYPYYPGYRPPYHYSRPYYPSHPPRPDHDGRPDHGGRPDHRPPPVADNDPPPLNRAPWRDLERMRQGGPRQGTSYRQPGPGAMGGGIGPIPDAQAGGSVRPPPPPSYRAERPRFGGVDAGDQGASRPAPRAERNAQHSAPRASESRDSTRRRSGTPDTIEP